jgi:hypothetical protein
LPPLITFSGTLRRITVSSTDSTLVGTFLEVEITATNDYTGDAVPFKIRVDFIENTSIHSDSDRMWYEVPTIANAP